MRVLKSIITVLLYFLILLALSLTCWFKSPTDFSESERRVLEQFPTLSFKTILSGEFMKDFEGYTTDQFPLRDTFRSIKAYASMGAFGQLDNNDIYVVNDNISKLEYPLSESMIENATDKFRYLYNKYMEDTDVNVYLSIIPDKNYFMAEENGYLSMDYEKLIRLIKKDTRYMEYIDIFDKLELEDYYRTDTHWKQEEIVHIAQYLNTAMNTNYSKNLKSVPVFNKENTSPYGFKGVYLGQSRLNIKPDEIRYLTNETIENCNVYSYSSGTKKEIEMYNFNKVYGKDAYEMYLNGTEALLVIENPNAKTDKELIMFRDSFGSSLAPLMIDGYSKITLIDIRYMNSDMIDKFVKFDNQDVLFIYSSIILNNSTALN